MLVQLYGKGNKSCFLRGKKATVRHGSGFWFDGMDICYGCSEEYMGTDGT